MTPLRWTPLVLSILLREDVADRLDAKTRIFQQKRKIAKAMTQSQQVFQIDLVKEFQNRCGREWFMAIEVLEGRSHTYRHDMESLFYVFLWVIIRRSQGAGHGLSEGSRLRVWYRESYAQIANTKRGHIDKQAFKGILAGVPLEFEGLKSLAEKLRDVLFPTDWERLFTGTYSDPDKLYQLYQLMIDAFVRAIASQTI